MDLYFETTVSTIQKNICYRSENEDRIPVVVHKQPSRLIPEPTILGPFILRDLPAFAVLQTTSGVGAGGLAQGHQAVESAVLQVEPYYEAAGKMKLWSS